MTVFVRIEFAIHEAMAWHAIESMLAKGEKVTKKKVINLCRKHLESEGSLFETEPQFDDIHADVDSEIVDYVFNKIWK